MRNADKIRKELIRASVTMFGYSIFDKSQKRDTHVYHRQTIMFILRKHYDYTLKYIGQICSVGEDKITKHDMVYYHVSQVKKDMDLRKTAQHKSRIESIKLWRAVIEIAHYEDRRADKVYQLLKRLSVRLDGEDLTTLNQIKNRLGYVEN
jgi:hypothetical protein